MNLGAVVVAYNSAADLPGCLDALLAADPAPQVVVVDNASSDASAALVEEGYRGRVRLVRAGANRGFAGGCNLGLGELAPEITCVAFMNPDVTVAPDGLGRCAAALTAAPDLAGVAPRLMRSDGVTVDSVGQCLDRVRLEVRDRGYGGPLTPELAEPRPVLAACGALAVYRRAALAAVADEDGAWAASYFCFWEDLELGWRLWNRGWQVRSCPDAVALHRRGAGASPGRGPLRWRRPAALEACVLSNRWITLIRHLHPRDLIPRLPVLLPWELVAVTTGVLRRPRLAAHLRRRWPLVVREWHRRRNAPRRRLRDLPC